MAAFRLPRGNRQEDVFEATPRSSAFHRGGVLGARQLRIGAIRIAVSRAPGAERVVTSTLGFTILTFGGPSLFLFAQLLFLRGTLGPAPRSRVLGLGALAILAVATAPLTLIVGIAASSAVLVAVAIVDTVREGELAPSESA